MNIRALQQRKAKASQNLRALLDAAGENEFSAEQQTQYDALKAEVDKLDGLIAREAEALEIERSVGGGNADRVTYGEGRMTDRAEADGSRGFATFGEFARAVVMASGFNGRRDERLTFEAAAPSTFGNESTGTDGGFAIPPDFSRDIWKLALGEESLLPRTANTEVGGNSMIFPKDESTPWGGTGVQAYWQVEATQGAQSNFKIGTSAMVLHKLMALCPVTNELIEDGFAFGSYLSPLIAERITWKVNEAILFGDGVGKPLGCLNAASKAMIVQAKETGQATLTLDPKNLSKMVSRLLVGEMGQAFWLATPDVLPALESLTLGQYPIYLPNNTIAGGSYGTLKGRPLMLSEHAEAFSSQSDISLLSLRGYRTLTKAAGVQTDTSMHLFFDSDAMAFRVRFRLNGAPILSAPVTPPKSNTTRSHFVTLAAR